MVIPTRNCSRDVGELLESLSKLDYPDLEILVVDSSEDDTPLVVSRHGAAKLIRVERLGLNVARNLGVELASGEVIAFTDCDCVVPPDWIRNILKALEETGAAVVGGSALNYYKGGYLTDYANEGIWPLMPVYEKRVLVTKENFHRIRLPPGNNMAFRREVFEAGYRFDEGYRGGSDEIDLFWRLCRDGYLIVADPDVVVYHKHRASLTELVRQAFSYGRGHYVFYSKNPDSPLARVPVYAACAIFLYSALLVALSLLRSPLALVLAKLAGALTAFGYLALLCYYGLGKRLGLARSTTYPLLDLLCHSSYLLGFLYEAILSLLGKSRIRERASSRSGCSGRRRNRGVASSRQS